MAEELTKCQEREQEHAGEPGQAGDVHHIPLYAPGLSGVSSGIMQLAVPEFEPVLATPEEPLLSPQEDDTPGEHALLEADDGSQIEETSLDEGQDDFRTMDPALPRGSEEEPLLSEPTLPRPPVVTEAGTTEHMEDTEIHEPPRSVLEKHDEPAVEPVEDTAQDAHGAAVTESVPDEEQLSDVQEEEERQAEEKQVEDQLAASASFSFSEDSFALENTVETEKNKSAFTHKTEPEPEPEPAPEQEQEPEHELGHEKPDEPELKGAPTTGQPEIVITAPEVTPEEADVTDQVDDVGTEEAEAEEQADVEKTDEGSVPHGYGTT